MTEQDRGSHQAEVGHQTPQPKTDCEGFLIAGEHLIGNTTFHAEHIPNSDGTINRVLILPKPQIEHRFGPGDVILS